MLYCIHNTAIWCIRSPKQMTRRETMKWMLWRLFLGASTIIHFKSYFWKGPMYRQWISDKISNSNSDVVFLFTYRIIQNSQLHDLKTLYHINCNRWIILDMHSVIVLKFWVVFDSDEIQQNTRNAENWNMTCIQLYRHILQGGFKAVVWTDVFQSIFMYVGVFTVLVKVIEFD